MMRDYAAISKRLRRYSENCVAYKLDADFADAVSDAADAIEELLAELATIRNQLPRWVSVEDELPKLGERVLITNGSFVCESYQSQGKRWMRHGCYMDYMQPTHWMPLPAPPKEDKP